MRRLLPLLVLLAVPAYVAADDPMPFLPPVDWEARDAEGRWAAFTRSGVPEDRWIPFLAERKEWDLLEWIALTSRGPAAFEALAVADAPNWIRVAAWRLGVEDSHDLGSAWARLERKSPGLALDWMERHPGDATGRVEGLLRTLREKAPAREDSSRFLAPLLPEAVLRDLVPPPVVEDFGDRTRASLGAVYVQQVERALSALALVVLRGEPWRARLAALLGHPHPRIRRAAALTYAHWPAPEVPVEALAARADDASEVAEVRAAAVLGLSYGSHPSAYALLLRVSRTPDHPAWSAAVSRLGDLDDGFVPTAWAELARTPLLDAQVARIVERMRTSDAETLAQRVVPVLERAAWVDLNCDPLEGPLVDWTLATLRAWRARAPVQKALEETASAYEAPPGLDSTFQQRVRETAAEVLK